MSKITLLLVDDHRLILDAWTFMLNNDSRFEVLGGAGDSDAALSLAESLRPRIILCDIRITPLDGIALTPLLRKRVPGAGIIGVSVYNIPAYAKKMIQAGASGYISKNSPVAELKQAILDVYGGKKYICNEIKQKLTESELIEKPGSRVSRLTRKELDVIQAVKEGFSSKEIARKLSMALKTVEVHRYHILKKLKLPNSAALVNFINLHGL